VTRLLKLLQRRLIIGSSVFDLQMIATMQANDVRCVYTFNGADFEIFPELTVITP